MSKKCFGLMLGAILFVISIPADAQQAGKVPRIGILYLSASANSNRTEAFRQGLRELGHVEGKHIVIEERYAEGKLERLPALAADLVRLKVDVIVTGGATITRAAKKATATIPIVMAQDSDPVANGFVASLARPGGNITGLSTLAPEISGKRLELLKEIVPRLSRVAVLWTPKSPASRYAWKVIRSPAKRLGLQLHSTELRSSKDLGTAFDDAVRAGAGALISTSGVIPTFGQEWIQSLSEKSRLPSIFTNASSVKAGGLMSYNRATEDLYRRAATYVDKILKGAKPADLPVEQPKVFRLVINLKTAKQLGLTFPPSILYRADKVIK